MPKEKKNKMRKKSNNIRFIELLSRSAAKSIEYFVLSIEYSSTKYGSKQL